MVVKAKKKLKSFDRILLILNCLSASFLLISYLSPITDPADFWIIALFGLAYPFLILINLIFVVYWLFRVVKYSLISTVCILLGVKIMMANFGFHEIYSGNKKSSSESIRIMAYNVHGFGGFDKNNGKQVQDGIMQLINDEHPDIVNLEEFFENVYTRQTIYSSLKKATNSGHHYFKPYDYTQWDSAGIAIFSRFPIINHGVITSPIPDNQPQAIFVDLKNGNNIFRVYCVHLQSIKIDDHQHLYLKNMERHGKVSVHELSLIAAKLKKAYIKRSYQQALIKSDLIRCPYPYIIAGDFNDTPISFSINQIGKGLKNAFIERGNGIGITYYGDFPGFQIDYIFTSQQFDIINYQIVNKKLSDHYPVISDLSLKSRLN